AGSLATQKVRVINRRFKVQQISELVDVERNLRRVDVDQIGYWLETCRHDERSKNIRRHFVVEHDLAAAESVAPRLVMNEPVRAAQSSVGVIAKTCNESADVLVEFIRLDHLVEVGIDPTVLSPHKKDDNAGRDGRKQFAQPSRVIWSQILGREYHRLRLRSPALKKVSKDLGRIERAD